MASVSKKQKKSIQKPPKSRPEATSALSQPVVAGSAPLAALSSFSPDGHSFALLTLAVDKHKLRVFDVANGNVAGEYVLQVSSGTCLQWTKISNTDRGRPSSPSKKRKRTDQESGNTTSNTLISVVMLGLANGSLTFFSPGKGTTVLSLSHQSSTVAILSATMDSDENCVWTTSANGSIYRWDISSNTIVGSWKSANNSPYSNICLVPRASTGHDEPRQILAASHAIDLIEVSPENTTPKTATTFSGHVTKVISMKWISSASQQSRFITSAERDRFVQGWTIPSSGTDGRMSFSAPIGGDVRKVQVTPDGKLFLVLSSTGIICLFAPPSSSSTSASKPLEPLSVIEFNTSKGTALTQTYDILDATFALDIEGTIQVARLAEGARPVFQSIV
jgi:U3 small nucleolar RNA-associated protein 5